MVDRNRSNEFKKLWHAGWKTECSSSLSIENMKTSLAWKCSVVKGHSEIKIERDRVRDRSRETAPGNHGRNCQRRANRGSINWWTSGISTFYCHCDEWATELLPGSPCEGLLLLAKFYIAFSLILSHPRTRFSSFHSFFVLSFQTMNQSAHLLSPCHTHDVPLHHISLWISLSNWIQSV